jgi:alginate export protein
MPGQRSQPRKIRATSLLLAITALAPALLSQDAGLADSGTGASATALRLGTIKVNGSLRVRAEGWNWFLDNTRKLYGFGESLLKVSFSQSRHAFDWQIEFEQASLLGLPPDAFLAGTHEPLGLGATYFVANGSHRNTAGLFISQGFVRLRGLTGNSDWLRVGRFDFGDGLEGQTSDPTVIWLKRERIAHRLIGDSYWTDTGRSMDGVHFSANLGSRQNVTFVAARPTRGVYDTDGWGEMDVDILYLAFTREISTGKTNASELRAFGSGYHDGRHVLKVDNRPSAVRQSDTHNIRIGTFGANYLLASATKFGGFDLLVWGAVQTGSWGVLHHHAAGITGEIGWQPTRKWWRPWVRAGALSTSADGNPNDGKHTTFFQILPTERQYARIPFYSMQNVEDYTGQLILRPSNRLQLRSEIHKVKLHGSKDLWYQGTGAFQNTSFGFEGRPARAAGGLANFIDLGGDITASSRLHFSFYAGAFSGKSTMTLRANGRKAGFTYLELAYRF